MIGWIKKHKWTIAFVLFGLYVITQPLGAADMVNRTWDRATGAGSSLATFANNVGK